MPIISVKVSNQELHAISEYAAQCGETIPDLIRKSIIREATLADGYGDLDLSYEYRMRIPENCNASSQRRITELNYNKVRRIMGLTTIKL